MVAGFGSCRCGTRVEGSPVAVLLSVRLPGRALEREPRRSAVSARKRAAAPAGPIAGRASRAPFATLPRRVARPALL